MSCRALRRLMGAVAVSALITAAGCGGPDYEIAEVDGVLLIKGEPGHKVRIEFVPDVDVKGPASAAETDANGRFVLNVMTRDGSSLAGAVVGVHRVTLSDLQLAASETGRDVPIRFGPEYTMASSTSLVREVKPGKQTIDLSIP